MKSITFCFFACFFIFDFIGCSKEDSIIQNEKHLTGIWHEEEYLSEYNRISKLQYNFRENDSLEVLRMEIEIDSRKILGYRYRTLGKYKITDDHITFYNLVSYSNDDTQGSYTEIENLQLVNGSDGDSYIVTYKIEEYGNKLFLIYPPCGPAENCIGTKILIKEW